MSESDKYVCVICTAKKGLINAAAVEEGDGDDGEEGDDKCWKVRAERMFVRSLIAILYM